MIHKKVFVVVSSWIFRHTAVRHTEEIQFHLSQSCLKALTNHATKPTHVGLFLPYTHNLQKIE
jgi:hypothetical protein